MVMDTYMRPSTSIEDPDRNFSYVVPTSWVLPDWIWKKNATALKSEISAGMLCGARCFPDQETDSKYRTKGPTKGEISVVVMNIDSCVEFVPTVQWRDNAMDV